MSFREKSAWGMGVVIALTGLFYGWIVAQAPQAPVIGTLLPYVLLVIVLSILVQILLAFISLREASAPADERERIVIARAGHWSGIALGAMALIAAGGYVATGNGNLLFHLLIGAVIIAQVLEYMFQIALFRRGF